MTQGPGTPSACQPLPVGAQPKRVTRTVDVRWGDHVVKLGGSAPVVVQSMTNTDTVDAIATAIQVKELARAGSELVRITVNTPEAAREVPAIREQLDRMGVNVPLVGTFITTGTSCWPTFRNAHKPCPSTGSIRAIWAGQASGR